MDCVKIPIYCKILLNFYKFVAILKARHMANHLLRKSVYRVISDLVKSDGAISIDELDLMGSIEASYGITLEDKHGGYAMTLADAAEHIAGQKPQVGEKLISTLERCALKDGECCRGESMLISAIETVCDGKGKILSLPLHNRPILSSQILYVDPTYNPKRNELDKRYDEIRTIAEIAGFDLIYIPQVAATFRKYKGTGELKRLLHLINPVLDDTALTHKATSLQDMDSRFFYIQVLNGRLQMNLDLDKPTWLIRLHNNVVNGTDYANYFCYDVDVDNISYQLSEYIRRLNSRMNSYSVVVNRHSDMTPAFPYDGFHKALLDVMAADKMQPWEIKVYVRGGMSSVADRSGNGKKFSVSIHKGDKSYPVLINGREAAFYLLALCASAGPEGGINLEYDRERTQLIQTMYDACYKMVSNRDSHTPDITASSTFRPVKTRVLQQLMNCGIKGDLHLFKPTKKGNHIYYIPLPSEYVKIVSSEGETLLKDSSIFKTYLKTFKNQH